ncbi:uncharacterized protein LOC122509188 isoform X1 [Leptopilina heterotoma]|uniref:uncharacterized protein LOC122509188 isoform X1 n=1 Tax=Leptopilina heterotoma TaxID=63436 RepID=UPI001CA7E45A|nr:uncharacterized protein LOC122509188 isoform X1 [Leptopilina heterotoma]
MVETKNIKIVTSMEEKDFFFVVREKRKKKKRERKEKKGWLFSPVNNISISLFHWYFIIIHISISLLHRYFIGICDQVRMLIRFGLQEGTCCHPETSSGDRGHSCFRQFALANV